MICFWYPPMQSIHVGYTYTHIHTPFFELNGLSVRTLSVFGTRGLF